MKREESENRKNKWGLLILLIILFIIMVIVYIPLAYKTKLKEKESLDIKDWNIETDVMDFNLSSSDSDNLEKFKPYTIGNTMYFSVEFDNPGDYVVYDINLKNSGRINSILNKINVNIDDSNNKRKAIKYEIIDLKEGDKLNTGENKKFKIKVYWDSSVPGVNKITNSTIVVNLEFIQE